ncbi:MAG TPA: hypothetical protein VHZ54_06880 [Solirubrobacterales bacterium]|jgi:hypothetical protein|nr:hypothetical protein [Solirubrobacterales bacterium]
MVAAGAMLLALVPVAGASASSRAHRRHIEVREPSSSGYVYLGERDGYEIALSLEEPDIAVLSVDEFDTETQDGAVTRYGARFHGSLPFGRLRARFGSLGTVSLRFRPDGKRRFSKNEGNCSGRPPRDERGYFVGRISLRGEDDYFHISTRKLGGELRRRFRVRCRVKRQRPSYGPQSLSEAVDYGVVGFGVDDNAGSLAVLEAQHREDGREVALLAARFVRSSAPYVAAFAYEHQGGMPVARGAEIPEGPPGMLLTTLPGEHPATATLSPPAPFSGEGAFAAASSTVHSWTGTLAVQFPGLLQPLAGTDFFSTLCVISPLRVRYGCDGVPPDWQGVEPSARTEWGRG